MLSDHYIQKIVIYNRLKTYLTVSLQAKITSKTYLFHLHNHLAFNEHTLFAPLLFSFQEVQK